MAKLFELFIEITSPVWSNLVQPTTPNKLNKTINYATNTKRPRCEGLMQASIPSLLLPLAQQISFKREQTVHIRNFEVSQIHKFTIKFPNSRLPHDS